MASMTWYATRSSWRIAYVLKLPQGEVHRSKYTQHRDGARLLKRELEHLERATRTRIAKDQEIEEWMDKGWVKENEADLIFTGYAETSSRKRRQRRSRASFLWCAQQDSNL